MFFSTVEPTFLEEVQGILPVSVATDREKLWPFIEKAERKYILPLLERELYDDLQKFCNDRTNWQSGSGGVSGEDTVMTTELIRLIRIAELNLAYCLGFDVLNVKISDAGFQRMGESTAFKGLYKYQEENLRKYFESTGYDGLDDMLKYIEDYIEYFPEWEDSTNYTARKIAIIKDAETFDAICFIGKSRLTFLRLQRYINEIIDFEIKPLLGDEWPVLMIELAKEDPADKYLALATEIRKPLAYLSCAKLIEKTGNLTDRGLFFEGKNSMFPDDSTKKPVEGDSALVAMQSYISTGLKYIDALRKYLIDNLFTDHGSENGSVFDRDNTDKKTFVA
jgi:hypothetical protein